MAAVRQLALSLRCCSAPLLHRNSTTGKWPLLIARVRLVALPWWQAEWSSSGFMPSDTFSKAATSPRQQQSATWPSRLINGIIYVEEKLMISPQLGTLIVFWWSHQLPNQEQSFPTKKKGIKLFYSNVLWIQMKGGDPVREVSHLVEYGIVDPLLQ